MTRIIELLRPREPGDPFAEQSMRWAGKIAQEFPGALIKPWSPFTGNPIRGDDRLGALITTNSARADGREVQVWMYVAAREWIAGRREIHVQVYGDNTGGRSRDFMAERGPAHIAQWARGVLPEVVELIDVPRAGTARSSRRTRSLRGPLR